MFRFMRKKCVKHEWLANGLMIVGSLLFAATMIFFILYQQDILAWAHKNPVINPIIIGSAVIFEVLLFFGISRLVFVDCSQEQEKHMGAYAGRKSRETPVAGVIQKMGVNPKRR